MAITKYKSHVQATSHKFEQIFIVPEVIHITCNMGAGDLADSYAQHPRATGLRADDIHIRQIPHVHVTTFECTVYDTDRNFCIMTQSLFISQYNIYHNMTYITIRHTYVKIYLH